VFQTLRDVVGAAGEIPADEPPPSMIRHADVNAIEVGACN
jgi:hypothetical protein